MRLFEIVGELKAKIPPPAFLVGVSLGRSTPWPPRMVNPSRRSAVVKSEPKTTTEHWTEPGSGAQKSFAGSGGVEAPWMQVLPVPSIVVIAAPWTEKTDTPGFMRIDSRYVPGATETWSPLAEWQIASWIRQ